jgi:hypothetical protein
MGGTNNADITYYFISAEVDERWRNDNIFRILYVGVDNEGPHSTGYTCWCNHITSRNVKYFNNIDEAKEYFYRNEKFLRYNSRFKNVCIIKLEETIVEELNCEEE